MPSAVPGELRAERDAADAAQRLRAEDARGEAAPRAAQAVQRPHAEHVVDLPAVLRQREHEHEEAAGDEAGDERAQRMHDVRARAHGDRAPRAARCARSPGRCARRRTRRCVPPAIASSEFIATRPEILSTDCADITLNPNQPTDSTHAPSARNGIDDGGCAAMPPFLRVAAAPRAQHQHGHEPDPAAERVHDHAAGEVVELLAERRLRATPGSRSAGSTRCPRRTGTGSRRAGTSRRAAD